MEYSLSKYKILRKFSLSSLKRVHFVVQELISNTICVETEQNHKFLSILLHLPACFNQRSLSLFFGILQKMFLLKYLESSL